MSAGRIAVITGGGGDIGGAIAARLVPDGWTVIVADLDLPAARGIADTLSAGAPEPCRVHARRLDVADPADIDAFVTAAATEFGRIDAVVCAAGVEPPQDLAGIDVASWDHTQAVNLRGPALIAQAALPWWTRQRSGSLVTIGSRTWLGGGHPGYAASKAGLVGLTRSLALELAPIGVRANAVAPSFVRTRFSKQRGDERMLDDYAERVRAATPMGELIRPEDVANAVAFLVSDQSARITGEVLHVCAGSQLPLFLT
ncbi:3-oxoacyl-ACP reductase [Actinomadura sp. NBRC 104412]|uniref:SDR family NAD(P)-dependent oxidoreductase n=1 Tax=Actinomadura sp. NBRC 104412 TaxID=3032203 RepID=UPI0024A3620F|nr:SDR family oxidoreductase [Actinomadura sp. NBRC 104412]GLZ09210.1 3-oxoacyl-ACP reductase [Actinomadura sp. NBRC 104412]